MTILYIIIGAIAWQLITTIIGLITDEEKCIYLGCGIWFLICYGISFAVTKIREFWQKNFVVQTVLYFRDSGRVEFRRCSPKYADLLTTYGKYSFPHGNLYPTEIIIKGKETTVLPTFFSSDTDEYNAHKGNKAFIHKAEEWKKLPKRYRFAYNGGVNYRYCPKSVWENYPSVPRFSIKAAKKKEKEEKLEN